MKKKEKNKFLLLGIILCLLFSLTVVPAVAEIIDSGTCGDNLTWTLNDSGTLTISGIGDMWDFDPPPWGNFNSSITSVIIQKGVTSIGNNAFFGCDLTSVAIPNGVTSIGYGAFRNCYSLTSVTIPNGVTSIEYFTFESCDSLTSVTIPNSVTSIGDFAFYDCNSLISVTIPNGVTSIGYFTFESCDSLTSVTIPDSVTSIGDDAFSGCPSLTSITIPGSVTSIGDFAFSGCDSLTSVTIPDSVTSIGNAVFSSCNNLISINVSENNDNYTSIDGVLFNKDKTELICYPSGKSVQYTIPDSVTTIGEFAFYDCDSLASVTIPDSVTSIGDDAFHGCHSLTSVTIPDSVTRIGSYAFYGCHSLTSVTIPDSVTRIGSYAFCSCNSLKYIYYFGTKADWKNISIGSDNDCLTNATKHYYLHSQQSLVKIIYYNNETLTLLENGILDIGENLYFRNGYINAQNGYIKSGNRIITGEKIYFDNKGKMHLEAGYTAKVERDNGDGTTDQGFMAVMKNPNEIITMTLEVAGVANDIDYTGRTITQEFSFTRYEVSGLVSFGFTVSNIPKPLSLRVQSIK